MQMKTNRVSLDTVRELESYTLLNGIKMMNLYNKSKKMGVLCLYAIQVNTAIFLSY